MESLQTIKFSPVPSSPSEAANQKAQKDYYNLDATIQKPGQSASETKPNMVAVWRGQCAARLGLAGAVQQEDFSAVYDGYKPDRSERNRGEVERSDHQENALFDVVLTCKKSVSMQINLGNDPRLWEEIDAAVDEVFELIEHHHAQARRQVSGVREIIDTEGIVAVKMPHHTSRAEDPNEHWHCLVMNATYCEDGRWRSLLDRSLSQSRYLGDYFQMRCAARLQAIGYKVRETVTESGHPSWELAGYTDEQIKVFSKRSQNPKVSELMAQGFSRDQALLKTRAAKEPNENIEQLRSQWATEAEQRGIKAILPASAPILSHESLRRNAAEILESAINHLSYHRCHFSREQIKQYAYKFNWSWRDADLEKAIAAHPELIDYGKIRRSKALEGRFTTAAALSRELRIIRAWRQGHEKATPICNQRQAEFALAEVALNSGQRQAIEGVLTSRSQHQMIEGLSGTGKTTAMRTLKAIAERQGIEVVGYAPSRAAAKKLGASLGIKAKTVQSLAMVSDLKPNQLAVLDEGGLDSASMLDSVLEKANAIGARILLVGDTRQNQAVEAGSPMRSLIAAGEPVLKIGEIIRQQDKIQREAVQRIATGYALEALDLLTAHGYVTEIPGQPERIRALGDAYLVLSAKEKKRTAIVTGTHAEANEITDYIRTGQKAAGVLGKSKTCIGLRSKNLTPEEAKFAQNYQVGDYIQLQQAYARCTLRPKTFYKVIARKDDVLTMTDGTTEHAFKPATCRRKQVYSAQTLDIAEGDTLRANQSINGLDNGDSITILTIKGKSAQIQAEDGQEMQLRLDQPLCFEHNLVQTSHRAQGSDWHRVFVSATDDATSRQEPFYVAISRQVKAIKVWAANLENLRERVQESGAQRNPSELLGDFYVENRNLARGKQSKRGSAGKRDGGSEPQLTVSAPGPGEPAERRHLRDTGRSAGSDARIVARVPAQKRGQRSGQGNEQDSGELRNAATGAGEYRKHTDRIAQSTAGLERKPSAIREQDRPAFERLAAELFAERFRRAIAPYLDQLKRQHSQLSSLRITEQLTELAALREAYAKRSAAIELKLGKLMAALTHQTQAAAISEWEAVRVEHPTYRAEAALIDAISIVKQAIEPPSTVGGLGPVQPPEPALAATNRLAETVAGNQQTELLESLPVGALQLPERVEPFEIWDTEYALGPPETLDLAHWVEMQHSAIHPELAVANIQTMSGQPVLERLTDKRLEQLSGDANQYATREVQRILKPYERAVSRGWWGDAGWDALTLNSKAQKVDWGVFKSDTPALEIRKGLLPQRWRGDVDQKAKHRTEEALAVSALFAVGINANKFMTFRSRKYLNPEGTQRHLYLPAVPESIAKQIYAKYEIAPRFPGQVFWAAIAENPQVPIVATEGLKKTLSGLSQLEVTIGLAGVNASYRARDENGQLLAQRVLSPELAVFAVPGRTITFSFDQDSNPTTIRDVRREMVRGALLLQAEGVTTKSAQWDGAQGKGQDDLIYKAGSKAWLDAIEHAPSTEAAERIHCRGQFLKLKYQVNRDLPGLSELFRDCEIYLRAARSGEAQDGARVIRQSDAARKLPAPQRERYVEQVRAAIPAHIQALSERIKQQHGQQTYQILHREVLAIRENLPKKQIDLEIYLRAVSGALNIRSIFSHESPAYIERLGQVAPAYRAKQEAVMAAIIQQAERIMGSSFMQLVSGLRISRSEAGHRIEQVNGPVLLASVNGKITRFAQSERLLQRLQAIKKTPHLKARRGARL